MIQASGDGAEVENKGDFSFEGRWTKVAEKRTPSPIRALSAIIAKSPGMISLGAGRPHEGTFPVKGMKMSVDLGEGVGEVELDEEEMQGALQYSPTVGLPCLLDRLKRFQMSHHALGDRKYDVMVGTGSQDLLTRVLGAVVEPGESVLVESPCYSGTLAFLAPFANLVGIETDEKGLIPEALERVLEEWEGEKPKTLVVVPTGSNPSGASLPKDRLQNIYRIAQRFDLLIVEDDPYHFLRFPPAPSPLPSFLRIDTDGRVARLDSFSKILCPGFRIGFLTAPPPLVQRVALGMGATAMHTSGLAQACTHALLRTMEFGNIASPPIGPKFHAHLDRIRESYAARCKVALDACREHLTGLATWGEPDAGMFLWIKLVGVENSVHVVEGPARDAKVLLVPGSYFYPPLPDGSWPPSPYVRAAFSSVPLEDITEAIRRLGSCLRSMHKS